MNISDYLLNISDYLLNINDKKVVNLFSLQKREEGPGYTLRILKRSQVRNDPDNFALKFLNKHWTVTHSFPLKKLCI